MLAILASLGTKWTGLGKWRLPIIIGALAAVLMTLAYCQGQSAGKAGEKLEQAEAAAKIDATADKADAKAADARVDSAREAAAQAKELEDATRDAESPDDARRRRGCAIMRQQGFDTTQIASCR